MEVFVEQRQELPAGGTSFLQIRHELLLTLLLRLLDQHFGIADDLIKRRAQVVDQSRGQGLPACFVCWKMRFHHGMGLPAEVIPPAPPLRSASILPSRRGN